MKNNNNNQRPPAWPMKILKPFLRTEYLEEIEGDMEEVYSDLLEKYSRSKANQIYILESAKLFKPALLNKLSGNQKLNIYGMVKLLFKTTTRSFLKNRLVTGMSLLTLILGAIFFQLVYSWISNEQQMDAIHSKADRIHIGVARFNPKADLAAIDIQGLFGVDFSQFPAVEKVLVSHTYNPGEIKFIADNVAYSGKALIVDSTFFDFFDFKMLRGGKHTLDNPSSIIVSQEYAQRVFHGEEPMGKMVQIKCDQEGLYQVAGIIDNMPSNSSITFDFLVPRQSQDRWRRMPQNLLLVNQQFDAVAFNQQIAELGREGGRFPESILSTVPFKEVYESRPFEISLFSKYGDKMSLQTMEVIAAVILLITLISFVNLQTTVQLSMVEKMGVKKAIGAAKFDLGLEIFVNRFVYFGLAILLSFAIYQLIFSFYVKVMELDLDKSPVFDLEVMSSVIGGVVFISMITALAKINQIKAIQALSGKLSFLKIPRAQRILITGQYAVTILLLVATAVVFLQLKYMLNMDTGLSQDNIIKTDFFEITPRDSVARAKMTAQYQYVMDQLRRNPDILTVSQGDMPIDEAYPNSWKKVGEATDYTPVNTMSVDPNYKALFGVEMLEGRFYSDSLDSQDDLKLVINEAAKAYWDIDDINNVKLATNTRRNGEQKYTIIGVVKDYHYQHLSQSIKPLVLPYYTYMDQDVLIKYRSGTQYEVVDKLDKLFREVNPGGIFNYETMEAKISEQYAKERRTSKINLAFSVVALLLATIGLFTFAFHETKRRTKEIGIRKVNGARVGQVFMSLSQSFIKSILIAFLLASPLAWYLMHLWLENFAYRIDLSWWIFGVVGTVITFIAFVTVSWQTLKIAKMNPVESLRYE